jgi:hypothetical protein
MDQFLRQDMHDGQDESSARDTIRHLMSGT